MNVTQATAPVHRPRKAYYGKYHPSSPHADFNDDQSCRSSSSTVSTVSTSTMSKSTGSIVVSKHAAPPKKRPSSTFGRIRSGIDKLRGLPSRDEYIERTQEEQDEYVFQKRMEILLKNPTLFRQFQERVRESGYATSVGVRMILGDFVSNLRMAELLEDLQQENDEYVVEAYTKRTKGQNRKRMGLFSSFGYNRTPKDITTTTTTTRTRTSSMGRKRLSSDNDDEGSSILTIDTSGFSLPSLEHTDYAESDDTSSMGVDTISGLSVRCSPPSSLRSLNSRQSSIRSINSREGQPDSLRSFKSTSTISTTAALSEIPIGKPTSLRSLMKAREGMVGSQRSLYSSHEAQEDELEFELSNN